MCLFVCLLVCVKVKVMMYLVNFLVVTTKHLTKKLSFGIQSRVAGKVWGWYLEAPGHMGPSARKQREAGAQLAFSSLFSLRAQSAEWRSPHLGWVALL